MGLGEFGCSPQLHFYLKAGKIALDRGVLDDLDTALSGINPNLLEVRCGAWAALASKNADLLRQAAHSARELVNQILQQAAPDNEITAHPGYQPDPSSKSGVTRRMRLRFIMTIRRDKSADSDLSVAEKAMDLVLALTDRLSAAAQDRNIPDAESVKGALSTAELALRCILL